VPYTTARGWVRRFRRRAPELGTGFAALAVELGGAVTTAGFAAGLGTGEPGAGVPGGTRAAPTAHTVAYVMMRRAAQAAASQQHLIEYARSVALDASGKPVHGYEVSWTYGTKYSGVGRDRRVDIVRGTVQTEYGNTWGHGRLTFTAVNYATRTWERRSYRWDTSSPPPAARGCTAWPNPRDYRAFLRWGLSCLQFKIAGTAKVDGVPTIKIVNVASRSGPRFTWDFRVNPQTYLPGRCSTTSTASRPWTGSTSRRLWPRPL
jgi:hypothetical protein